MVVDDSPTALQHAKDSLGAAGYTVVTAKDIWVSALVKKTQPDMILMDVQIGAGREKGLIALKSLKRFACKDVPIVLYSSLAAAQLREMARTSGADGYICKNSVKDLARQVKTFL